MYKALIISDSHGWTNELKDIRERHQDVDVAIHCGDSELNEKDAHLAGYQTVAGNCDWNGHFPNDMVIELGGRTILATHGHLFGIKGSLMKLSYRADEASADIVCYGHSHVANAEEVNGKLFINPGSIRQPRHFTEHSYVILEWDNNEEILVHFYDLEGREILNFPYP